MDNQHKKIKGYRDLTAEEIALMNEGKALAEQVGEFTAKLQAMPAQPVGANASDCIDKRWLAIGTTDLQKGFMSVIRSIAQPTSF